MTTDAYLTELAEHLRAAGLAPERVDDVLGELRDHLAASGELPEATFGPVGRFAADLLAESADPVPDAAVPGVEQRTFRATALDEVDILAELGRDGWELTGVRDFGLHASRPRDVAARRPWQYERRRTLRARALEQRMRADGWEPCGRWVPFSYFKRPGPASSR